MQPWTLGSTTIRIIGALWVSTTGAMTASASAQSTPSVTEVTVNEGTSMSVTSSPDGTTLAIDLQGSLWLVSARGGQARRITDVFNDARQPAWSPRGDAIAFQGYREGRYDIWIVSPDGSGLRNLTPDRYDEREPSWSHDGTRVAFSSDRGGQGSYDIWVLDVDGGQLTRVTEGPTDDFMPTWSPDDAEIAFASDRPEGQGIRTVSLATGAERDVTSPAEGMRADAPSWGPSGQLLYHVSGGGESALMVDGETITGDENAFPFRVSWVSPTEFFYTADGKIRRRAITGGGAETIEFSATLEVTTPSYERLTRDLDSRDPRPVLGIVRPQISPDGGTVAFAALGDIWLMRRGDEATRLTNDRHLDTEPAWSPDGNRLVYASDRGGGFLNLWLRDLRSGEERQLTTLSTSAMAPTWSPDGRSIAFLNVDGAWRRANVSVVDVETGDVRQIHESMFGPGTPTWSPDSRWVAVAALVPYSSRFREGLNQILLLPARGDGTERKWIVPLEQRSIDSRVGAGPAWSPDGSKMAVIYEGRLAIVPVSDEGDPLGPPVHVTTEMAHAPSWTADSQSILYQSMDELRLLDVASGATTDVPTSLTYTPQIPEGRLVVRAGLLVDGTSPEARRDVDIVIEGNRIVSVEPRGTTTYAGGEVVDASDLVVMPGLTDFHTHLQDDLGEAHGRAWLAFGVTTVRSPGGTPYEAAENREAIEAGVRAGPRIYSTGYLMEWQRVYYKMAVAVANEAHLALELERARVLRHDLVKSYVRMPDVQQRQMVDFAHAAGIPVASHEVYPAALNGVDMLEHAGGTSRRGYSPKTATLGRSYGDVAALMGAARMTFAPTVALSSVWLRAMVAREPSLRDDPRFSLVPEWLRARVMVPLTPDNAVPPQGAGPAGDLVMDARRAGARIVASTDSPLPASLHAELLAYVQAGMTPYEALQTATVNPALALGLDAGTVEPGRIADLVIVDGNPLEDIGNAQRVRMVIANGRLFTLSDLVDGT